MEPATPSVVRSRRGEREMMRNAGGSAERQPSAATPIPNGIWGFWISHSSQRRTLIDLEDVDLLDALTIDKVFVVGRISEPCRHTLSPYYTLKGFMAWSH
ncbi:hypothetical protein MLD38_029300 [Melastoma candidum]|uniref:Uncharacterized protein n=1 Tax=Melastoma candidum TaxID=119954 RepID=A0ACB9N3B5_9MYRT|nr:hypothetical protein MLD38_029300 [Melastoma candidum]